MAPTSLFGIFLAFERSRRKRARSCSGAVVTHIFQKPLDNGYHRFCVISINTLGHGQKIVIEIFFQRMGFATSDILTNDGLISEFICPVSIRRGWSKQQQQDPPCV